jgi:4-amino-4-deoxy-L-arabinose transferase-like glycosyltransferase
MNNDSLPPHLSEPTVLDLFKSFFQDRQRFWAILQVLSSSEEMSSPEREEMLALTGNEPASIALEQATEPLAAPAGAFPWRSVLATVLALYAQASLEPPGRKVALALGFYLIALALLLWAWWKEEWQLPALPPSSLAQVSLPKIPLLPLLLSTVLALAAFLEFKNDLFTPLNVTLWGLSLFFFFLALWENRPSLLSLWERLREFLQRPAWQINITRWGLLVLLVAAIVTFFRLYRIDAIPAEPFSDHAEKILDVYDITQGQTRIFFPRNTGREALQMYWTLLVAKVFGSGLSFLSLKIGTALLGLLTLPYMYWLGKEWGSSRVGLLAMFLFGIAYWPNVISRIGLRFPLYPLFVAPTLLYLTRGLRTRQLNDFLLAGLFLGLGLHGYSPFRIMPFVVVAAFGVYWLHPQASGARRQAVAWLLIVAWTSLLLFLPLARYALEYPDVFAYRAFSRLGTVEQPLAGPAWQIFAGNFWRGLQMFHWDDGEIWVNSIPHRPALDVVTAALFLFGALLLLLRYARQRDWRDLFLLISIPLLQLPSTLSLAFPGENPALNRAGGAAVTVILIAALALDGLITAFGSGQRRGWAALLVGFLLFTSLSQNYDLVFHQFDSQYRDGAWNTSEMGKVIQQFGQTYGQTDTLWIIPYPYWVDTRLPGIWAGIPNRDFAIFRENLPETLMKPYPKMFIYRPDDVESEAALRALYPQGTVSRYHSVYANKDFMLYFVPSE